MLRKLRTSFVTFLILSAFFHIGLFSGLISLPKRPVFTPPPAVEVEYLDPAEMAEKTMDWTNKQIVEQEKRLNDEKPEDTRHLSKFDQRVVDETRAERSGEFKNTAIEGAQRPGDPEEQKDKPEKKNLDHLPSLAQLKPQFSMTPKADQQEDGKPGDPSQTDDHLQNVRTGMQTMLSTREFVYYSYYTRIKDQLRQYWAPNVREKVKVIYRSGRSVASAGDHITQVIVILDANGVLEDIQVIGESGVKDFDDAAIEAFRSAAPFPNPPRGMVEKDGRIRLRWDFILEA